MSLYNEFKAFAVKGNVIDLAVAVVIGAAFTKIVNAFVDALIMPLVGRLLPADQWTAFEVGGLKVGTVIGAIFEFLIIAVVLFLVVAKLLQAAKKPRAEPATKTCPECLEKIPLAAKRCRACASPQA